MTETKNIITVQFREHPVIDYRNFEPEEVDVSSLNTSFPPDFITENVFNLTAYCYCLLNKLNQLPNSKFEEFLNHQCKLVKEPMCWINKFEKLIAENVDCCDTKKWKTSVMKINNLIELKRVQIKSEAKLKNNSHHTEHHNQYEFNFKKLKKEISTLSIEQQVISLHEAKADYLQNKPPFISTTATTFDESINIELEKIEKIAPFKKSSANDKSKTATIKEPSVHLNCNLNIFVDMFYQMLYEQFEDGKPLINSTSAEITDMICANFLDKDGNKISHASVRTILSPNKNDKRPKDGKRISLKLK